MSDSAADPSILKYAHVYGKLCGLDAVDVGSLEPVNYRVLPRMKEVSEDALRTLIRTYSLSILRTTYKPVQDGRAHRDPTWFTWIAVASDQGLQRAAVKLGSYLSDDEIVALLPAELIKACIEIMDYHQCFAGPGQLGRVVLEELRLFMPGLDRA